MFVVAIEMPLIHQLEKVGKMATSVFIGAILLASAYSLFMLPGALSICIAAVLIWTLGEILYFPFNNAISLNMSPAAIRGNLYVMVLDGLVPDRNFGSYCWDVSGGYLWI